MVAIKDKINFIFYDSEAYSSEYHTLKAYELFMATMKLKYKGK